METKFFNKWVCPKKLANLPIIDRIEAALANSNPIPGSTTLAEDPYEKDDGGYAT